MTALPSFCSLILPLLVAACLIVLAGCCSSTTPAPDPIIGSWHWSEPDAAGKVTFNADGTYNGPDFMYIVKGHPIGPYPERGKWEARGNGYYNLMSESDGTRQWYYAADRDVIFEKDRFFHRTGTPLELAGIKSRNLIRPADPLVGSWQYQWAHTYLLDVFSNGTYNRTTFLLSANGNFLVRETSTGIWTAQGNGIYFLGRNGTESRWDYSPELDVVSAEERIFSRALDR